MDRVGRTRRDGLVVVDSKSAAKESRARLIEIRNYALARPDRAGSIVAGFRKAIEELEAGRVRNSR